MTFYKAVTVDITHPQIKKAAKGQAITLSKSQLQGGSSKIYVHPAVYDKIQKAKKRGGGVRIHWSPEAARTTADLEGGSIGDWIKKAWKFVKDNADVFKPVASRVLDIAIPAASTYLGQPALAVPGRAAVKQLTGLGIKKMGKGTPEMKQHMANLRARRGASFRLN